MVEFVQDTSHGGSIRWQVLGAMYYQFTPFVTDSQTLQHDVTSFSGWNLFSQDLQYEDTITVNIHFDSLGLGSLRIHNTLRGEHLRCGVCNSPRGSSEGLLKVISRSEIGDLSLVGSTS